MCSMMLSVLGERPHMEKEEVTCMPTTLFTATHVLTADAAVLPHVFSGTALASAFIVYIEMSAVVEVQK